MASDTYYLSINTSVLYIDLLGDTYSIVGVVLDDSGDIFILESFNCTNFT
jgi:hypothetical protein